MLDPQRWVFSVAARALDPKPWIPSVIPIRLQATLGSPMAYVFNYMGPNPGYSDIIQRAWPEGGEGGYRNVQSIGPSPVIIHKRDLEKIAKPWEETGADGTQSGAIRAQSGAIRAQSHASTRDRAHRSCNWTHSGTHSGRGVGGCLREGGGQVRIGRHHNSSEQLPS